MNKITLPIILGTIILIAGMFAFSPIQQVSTVHDTLLGSVELSCDEVTATTSIVDTGGNDAAITETFDITNSAGATSPFTVENINVSTDGVDDASGGDDLSFLYSIHDNENIADIIPGAADVARVLSDALIFSALVSDGDTITITTTEDIDDTAEAGTNFDYTIQVCGYASDGGDLEIVET